jgi:uncharacterized protein (DUF924 family)
MPASDMRAAAWQPVLDFWFLPEGDPGHGKSRTEWFRKDPAFDLQIHERFGDALAQALAGEFVEWDGDVHGALARIILLDQFTRNTFRDTPRAFAGDARALAAAAAMVGSGRDRNLVPVERMFVYLPFEHAENLAMQERAVALFNALAAEPGMGDIADYALRHRDVIARFGRFPHRNRILGRESTREETEFLKLPGSAF